MKTSSTSRWLFHALRTLANHFGHTAVDHTHLFAPTPTEPAAKTAGASSRATAPAADAVCACCGTA